jgi:hypothetical protein
MLHNTFTTPANAMQASGFCAWGDPIPYACAQTVRDYCPYTEPPYRHTTGRSVDLPTATYR